MPRLEFRVAIATVVVLALTTGVAAAATEPKLDADDGVVSRIGTTTAPSSSTITNNVTAICLTTPYPSACETALSSSPPAPPPGSSSSSRGAATADPFAASVQYAMARATSARAVARNLSAGTRHRPRGAAHAYPPPGVQDCTELLDISLDQLGDALAAVAAAGRGGNNDADAVTTWLSAALTNQATCGDSLASDPDSAGREAVRARVSALSQFIATALALHVNKNKAAESTGDGGSPPSGSPPTPAAAAFPSWVTQHDRNLLESSSSSSSSRGGTSGGAVVAADAVVALDGSGTHRSINEAIAAVTAGGGGRKVIHVKAGRYEESVSISSKQKNVMLMGEGKGKSVIVGHKSAGEGYTTYASATVAAMGSGFIAKGLTIMNTAGPGNGQAVALRVGGDLSVIYQCSIQGYQDTLYVHSGRQFYSASDITGTVDFIFGNAAVVLQSCDIQARRPIHGQEDTVTAQGRTDPNQNTGISIHRCRVTGAPDLGGSSTPVYLGRPWRRYSRTVVIESFLDGSVSPAGWLQWSGNFALGTLYYGEYGNTGPGAGTGRRVTWPGVHTVMSRSDALRFTVAEFIVGDAWLGGTGVSYISGL